MKSNLKYLLTLLILFAGNILFVSGQIAISNSQTSSGAIKSCQQPGNFTIVFTNNGISDATAISRRLTIPSGLAFSWINSSLPAGCTLSKGADVNMMDITIDVLTPSQSVSINYTIEAGCNSVLTGNQTISSVSNSGDNNTYSSPLGSYIFNVQPGAIVQLAVVSGFQEVDGVATPGWAFSGNTGDQPVRSYKVYNKSTTQEFNGYLNFTDVFASTLIFEQLSISYLNAAGIQIYEPVFPLASGSFTYSFKINRLPVGGEIKISEKFTVLACLGNSVTNVSMSFGCYAGDQFDDVSDPANPTNTIFNKQIDISKKDGAPNFVIVPPNSPSFPICVLGNGAGNQYDREVTYRNDGTSALNTQVFFWVDDPNFYQLSSTVVPIEFCSLTVYKADGRELKYFGADLKPFLSGYFTNFPNTIYPYSKCYSGEVLWAQNLITIPGLIIAHGESLKMQWRDIECCLQPSILRPQDWHGALYQTQSLTLFYNRDCDPTRYETSSLPDQNNDRKQNFQLTESLEPYNPHLQGMSRSYANAHGSDPSVEFSGDVEELSVKMVKVTESLRMNDANSFIEIDITLEDGLTLRRASINSTTQMYELLNGAYDVYLDNGGTRKDYTSVISPSIDNQAVAHDGINEVWTFKFPIASFQGFGSQVNLHDQFVEYMQNAKIKFTVRGLCNASPNPNFYVSTYLRPGDTSPSGCDCRIPLTTVNSFITVTCPGCLNPGINMQDVTLKRLNIGDIDNNNDGIADNLQGLPVTPDKTNKQLATFGDRIKTTQNITISDGDQGHGFTYDQLLIPTPDLLHPGILLDNIYVTTEYIPGIDLTACTLTVIKDGIEYPFLNHWRKIGNQYVFHINSTEVPGLSTGFDPKMSLSVRLENEFIVNKNDGGDNVLISITYSGILSDTDIDIFSIAAFPTFVNGTCNDRPSTFNCSTLMDFLKTTPDTYNFYCEPSASANFTYIPLIQDNTIYIPTAHPNNPNYRKLCDEVIEYRAAYKHAGPNSFPNEVRHYGTKLKFVYNLPPDYEVTNVELHNSVPVYVNNIRQYLQDNITLSPSDPSITYTTGPGIKGRLMEIIVNMSALTTLAGSTTNAHWGDEDLMLLVDINIAPTICGSSSKNYFYANGSDYNASIDNIYPFMNFTYEDFTFKDILPNQFSKLLSTYLLRPYTDLALLGSANHDHDITKQELCFDINIQSNPIISDPIATGVPLFGGGPGGFQVTNTQNTFLLFDGLPDGFTISKIVRTNLGGAGQDIFPSATQLTTGNNKVLFDAGPILSNTSPEFKICGSYDCRAPLNLDPFDLYYGWDCGTVFPTIAEIEANSVCYRKSEPYTLKSVDVNLVNTTTILPSPGTVCNFDLSIVASSTGNGNIHDYSIEVEVPTGLMFNSAISPVKLNGVDLTSVPIIDATNPNFSIYKWNDVYPGNMSQDGVQSFTFIMPLEIKCGFTNGPKINTKIKALSYCNTDLNNSDIIKTGEVTPSADLPPTAFDNLSLSPINFTRPSTNGVGISVEVTNNALAASSILDQYILTLPAGLIYQDATITNSGTTVSFNPSSNTNGVHTFNLPSINASELRTIQVNATLDGSVSCQDLADVSAKITSSAIISCYGESCTRTKDIVTMIGNTPCNVGCNLSVNAGSFPDVCEGESITFSPIVTSTVGPYTYTWTSNSGNWTYTSHSSPITTVAAQANTIYTFTVTDGNGCVSSSNATGIVKAKPAVSIPSTTPTFLVPGCQSSITLTTENVSADVISYQWSVNSGSGFVDIAGATASSLVVTTIGTYRITVKSGPPLNCENSDQVDVVNAFSITGPNSICEGQTANLSLSIGNVRGAFQQQWFQDGAIVPGGPSGNAGNYYALIVFTNPATASSCTLQTQNFLVNLLPSPAPFVVSPVNTNLACGESVELTGTPPSSSTPAIVSYSWNTGVSFTGMILSKIIVSEPDAYYITALGDNGCTSTSNMAIVTKPVLGISESCVSGGITLTGNVNVSGVTNYSWIDPDGIPLTGQTITATKNGNYTITSPDVNACSQFICVNKDANASGNLITNGNFDQGLVCNDLTYTSQLTCINTPRTQPTSPSTYTVTQDASFWNQATPGIPTGLWAGTGYQNPGNPTVINPNFFLLADGRVTPGAERIWERDQTVEACGRYRFRAWIRNAMSSPNQELPLAWLVVNNRKITAQTTFPDNAPWVQLNGEWDSQGETLANLSVMLGGGGIVGRDIMVDEISFEKIVCVGDQWVPQFIRPNSPDCKAFPRVGAAKFICSGSSIQIGENIPDNTLSYLWTTKDGWSSTSPNPIVSPTSTTVYKLMVTDLVTHCKSSDNVAVNIIQPTLKITSNKTNLCTAGVTPLTWVKVMGSTTTGNSIQKTGSTTFWDAGASSSQILDGDGFVSANIGSLSKQSMFGISYSDKGTDISGIDYGILLKTNNSIAICHNGIPVYSTYATHYVAGDQIKISINGNQITYYHNTTSIYSEAVITNGPMVADVSLYTQGASFNNVGISNITTVFRTSLFNGMGSPQFEWYLNNNLIETNSTGAFKPATLNSGDEIKCKLIGICPVTSNTIIMDWLSNPSGGGPDVNICNGSSAQLTATGGATYTWSPSAGLSNTTIANPVASPNITTAYNVLIEDITGCSKTYTVNVTVNAIPPVPTVAITGATTFCQGGSVTLSTTATEIAYQWLKDGIAIPGANASSHNATVAGSYTLQNGCSPVSNAIDINVNPASLSPAVSSNNLCTGQTGGLDIEISEPNVTAVLISSPFSQIYWMMPRPGGYTVAGEVGNTSTDIVVGAISAQGCTTLTTIPGIVHPAITNVSIAASPLTICPGGSSQLSANIIGGTAPFTYQWRSVVDENVFSSLASPSVSPASNTRYSLNITDAGGCAGGPLNDVTVIVAPLPAVNISADQTGICSSPVAMENVIWTNSIGAAMSGNNFAKTATSGWNNCGASSVQTIYEGGYVEYTVDVTSNQKIIGLNKVYSNAIVNNFKYAFSLVNGSLNILENGSTIGTFSTYAAGDKLKISVEGTTIKYYKNSTLLRTVTTNVPAPPFLVDITIFNNGASFNNVKVRRSCTPLATFTATVSNAGTNTSYQWYVNNVMAGTNSNTYASNVLAVNDQIKCIVTTDAVCASGVISSDIITMSTLVPSVVSVNITGATLIPTCSQLNVEDVIWTNLNGSIVNGTILTKTGTGGIWNGATSIQTVSEGGYVEYVVDNTTSIKAIGLSQNSSNGNYINIQYALYLNQGTITIVEANVNRGVFGSYLTGDRIRAVVENNSVRYYRNAQLIYTSTVIPNLPLLIDASMWNQNVTFANVKVKRSGGAVLNFMATGTNAGVNPVYQWYLNGQLAGLNNSTSFSGSTFLPGDLITCKLSSSDNCVTGSPATSNTLTIGAAQNTPGAGPSVSITGASLIPTCSQLNVEDVIWTNLNGSAVSGNILTKISNGGIWNGATSIQAVSEGGYVEYVVDNVSSNKVLGLSHSSANGNYVNIQYGFDLNQGLIYIVESNVNKGMVGTYLAGDRVRVVVENNSVKYYRNAQLLYISTAIPNLPLLIDASLWNQSGTFANVKVKRSGGAVLSFTATGTNAGVNPVYQWYLNGQLAGLNNSTSFSGSTFLPGDLITCKLSSSDNCITGSPATSNTLTIGSAQNTPGAGPSVSITGASLIPTCSQLNVEDVIWTNLNGSTVSGNILTKISNGGIWNGATSVQKISEGGYVEYIVDNASSNKVIGLSQNSAYGNYANIQYAFNLNQGSIYIIELNVNRGMFGSYLAGDRVRVVVEDNSVRYYRNAQLIYTSAVVPNLPLLVDASLWNQNGNFTGVKVKRSGGAVLSFTATGTNAGVNPVYQWYLNGQLAGQNNSTSFSGSTFLPGDLIICKLSSGDNCITGSPATSNILTMTSAQNSPGAGPSVSITGSNLTPGCTILNAEDVIWRNINGCTVSGTTLTKTSASGVWNGASSSQTVLGGGYVEYIVDNVTSSKMIGLSQNSSNGNYASIQYAIYLNQGSIYIYESGVNRGIVGTYLAGDRVRVSLENNLVEYYRNSQLTYTSTVVPNPPLLVDASLINLNGTFTGVKVKRSGGTVLSFAAGGTNAGVNPVYQWYLNGQLAGQNNSASFSSSALLPGDLITCKLSSSDNCITGSPALSNTLTLGAATTPTTSSVTISASSSSVCNTPVLEDVSWTNIVGSTVSGTNLTKTATTAWGNSGAASTQTLTEGGFVECTINDVTTYRMIGLSHTNLDANYTSIQYAIYIVNNATIGIYESGVSKLLGIPCTVSDKVRVSIENGGIFYYKNNVLIYNSAVVPVLPLIVDVAMYTQNTSLNNVKIQRQSSASTITFSATPTIPGTTPVYIWYVNNVVAGNNAATFVSSELKSGDGIKCLLSSSDPCVTGSPANSNVITLGSVACREVSLSDPLSIVDRNWSVELYPNPSSKDVNLHISNAVSENVVLEVIDMKGISVYKNEAVSTTSIFTFGSDLPSGVYVVKILDKHNQKTLCLVITR